MGEPGLSLDAALGISLLSLDEFWPVVLGARLATGGKYEMATEAKTSRTRNCRIAALVLAAVGAGMTTQSIWGGDPAPTTPAVGLPPAPAMSSTSAVSDPGRPAAIVYGNVSITYEEFGRFLMERGGAEKLELFVNKRIIEEEAKRLGVTVSKTEMEAALDEDLKGIDVKRDQFLEIVLPKYGKTLFEWMEDVIRPRLLISKMCRQRMVISEEDLKLQFERRYGEQRQVQIVMWPKNEKRQIVDTAWEKMRQSQEEFDHHARAQANPALAAACGHIKPITKHLMGEDKIVETKAYALKPGEMSEILWTQQGWMVMKLHKIIPPRTDVSYEKEKAGLEKAAFEEKLTNEIPKLFAEMKARANPKLLYTGPTDWRTIVSKTPALPAPPVQQTGGTVIQPPMQVTPK